MPNPHTAESKEALPAPNQQTRVEVHAQDLPLYCPTPGSSLWNSHPKVYIPLEAPGQSHRCIYCGTVYLRVD